jgi:hypothetical protein
MTAARSALSTSALAVAVLVTLVVYWLAENYAEVLGDQVTGGRLPSLAQIRRLLAGGWPMVSASFAPLAVLVLVRLAGASASSAATAGVGAAVVLLTVHGWSAGRASQLRGWQLAGATSTATVLELVLVVLKNFVILHLH